MRSIGRGQLDIANLLLYLLLLSDMFVCVPLLNEGKGVTEEEGDDGEGSGAVKNAGSRGIRRLAWVSWWCTRVARTSRAWDPNVLQRTSSSRSPDECP